MELTLGNITFNKQQLRALYQAICVEEDTNITDAFAKIALEDGVDIMNDMAKEPDHAGIVFDENDVRHQAKILVESSLSSFAKDINERIESTPLKLDVKVCVSATASIG